MPSAYSRSPRLTKGSLIQLSEGLVGPVPTILPFQYNPASITRKLTPYEPPEPPEAPEGEVQSDPQVQPYDPEETIDFTLFFDATDDLEEPESHPVAVASGVGHKLAALERMLYPVEDDGGLLGSVTSLLGGEVSGAVPRSVAPIVLLSLGPHLILPVRFVSYSVEQTQWSPTLAPERATVTLSLKVLTDRSFPEEGEGAQTGVAAEIARAAYRFTRTQRDQLVAAQLGDGLGRVLSILPF